MEAKFKCDIGTCDKTFKSLAGLEGHKRLSHSKGVRKSYPDEIGERLEALEAAAVSSTNPGNTIQTEDKVVTTLKLLLPAMEKFDLVVLPFGSRYDDDYLEMKRYRIIKNAGFTQAGFGGVVVSTSAEEL